jgi:hypothetical protein
VPRKLFTICFVLCAFVPLAAVIYVRFQLDSSLPIQPEPGHGRTYAVWPNHSRRFATREEVERLNRFDMAAFVGGIVAIVGAGMLTRAGSSPNVSLRHLELEGSAEEIRNALTLRGLGDFARFLLAPLRPHWRELLPMWLAITYFAVMVNFGRPLFGDTLTFGLLIPVPIFWAFVRATRPFVRSAISLIQAMVWIVLMPFVVAVMFSPLIRLVLGRSSP